MTLWEVKADAQRGYWDFDPLVSVGPLRFGMSCGEALTALGSPEDPPAKIPQLEASETSYQNVTMYFATGRLYCVAIDALVGPQVTVEGTPLVGRVPSEVEQWLLDYSQQQNLELRYTHAADPHLPDLGLIVRVQRAGDVVLSRPVFLDDRAEVSWDYVPSSEWHRF
ncbi:hypothetical protein GCM10023322_71230 [Rugosimonospora acidiphila]|uniref:Uncharacterized protein n=1 Tax=Rugosimonospora acidiphila TaxID=556531 RepID=A0ABP9SN91_9ACTN